MTSFSKVLIGWYAKNKRDLPWRGISDPYPVWLSEVILQQTRVDQGMSYYLKFLKLFPTVQHLAAATEDEVLKAWQGLGYYSRARNLHATAKTISNDFEGIFPNNSKALEKLKGIGPYTAAAIASFCFGEKSPVIDGNVYRVLTRLYGITEPVDTASGRIRLQQLAEKLIDAKYPGTYNQAIMEFGATHCTPHQPQCETCPFANFCVALKTESVQFFPVKEKKTLVKELYLYYFHISYRKEIYLHRRTKGGIWKGLYDFPHVESQTELDIKNVIKLFLAEHELAATSIVKQMSEEFIHVLSHRKIKARFVSLELKQRWMKPPENVFAVSQSKLEEYGVPRLIEKFFESLD